MSPASRSDDTAFVPMLWLGGAMVVLAALFRGGNRWAPLLALTLLGLALLVALAWSRPALGALAAAPRGRNLALGVLLLSPLWVALAQLLPLRRLEVGGWAPISLLPDETWYAALAGVPVVACAVLALTVPRQRLELLLWLWLGTAGLQALVGLLQLAFPALYFDDSPVGQAIGTFASRNSLGNYLAMLLPVVVLVILRPADRGRSRSRSRHLAAGLWLGLGLLLLLLSGLLASLSRGGIASGLLVLMLAWLLLGSPRRDEAPGAWRRWLPRLLPLAVLVFVMVSGGWNWLARFESGDAARLLNWRDTWLAAQHFWPLGSGLGSFGAVFPRFQAPELGRWYVNQAHNEYLQILLECGVLAVPSALALAYLLLRRIALLWGSRRGGGGWERPDAVALACGLGFLAQALHAWVDYPWRIPATAMLGAFLLGAFLREPKPGASERHAA